MKLYQNLHGNDIRNYQQVTNFVNNHPVAEFKKGAMSVYTQVINNRVLAKSFIYWPKRRSQMGATEIGMWHFRLHVTVKTKEGQKSGRFTACSEAYNETYIQRKPLVFLKLLRSRQYSLKTSVNFP
jgi:hypothetical protein